ncbi:MAG TPA: AsmA family protein [Terriglobales bacterium]|nr:AsmA family protein [Terriglobales bacterium]
MRKLWIALAVIVLLVVGAAVALPYVIDVNRYHGRIQAEIEKRVGRKVTLGPMKLSLLPFAIRVQGTTIAEDPSFGEGKVFAKADELYVRAELWPLLRGDVQVRSLELEKPQIELVKNAGGVWNFASLGHNAATTEQPAGVTREEQARAQQQKQDEQQAKQKPQEFALDRLRISDGQIAITDLKAKQPRAVYDHIDLAIEDYKPGHPFLIDLAAHLPGQGKQEARLNAKVGPIRDDNRLATPIDGTLKLEEVSIAGLQRFLNTPALAGADGIVSGDTTVKNADGKLAAKGALRIEQPKVKGVNIGYPIAADFDVREDLDSEVIRIEKGTLKLGATPLSVTGVMNAAPTPMQLDLRIWTPEAPIGEIARLASAFGVAFHKDMNIDGRVQADVQAKGAATQPLLNGNISAKNLSISGKGLKQPVQVQGIQLALSPTEVRSNDFAASTAGATVNVQFALTQYTTSNPQVQATVRTGGAQVEDVLNIARAYGIEAVEGVSGSGRITLDLRASGALKNASAMALSGSGSLQNANLQMPSLGTPVVVRNADLKFTQNSAVLQNLVGAIGSTNASGTVTLRNFAAPQVEFTLTADKLNLNELPAWFASKKAQAGVVTPLANAAEEGALAKMTGRGKIAVGTILYDQLVMNNAKSDATLDHGVIRLAPLTAEIYGGMQTGSIVIDTRPDPIQYAVNTKLEKVDANKLLSSTTSLKQTLYGLLMANANTSFRSGSSSDQIARSLNGTLNLNLRNGKIANMDLWYELANAGKFLTTGQKFSEQPFTNLVALTGDFDVQNGVAQTNNLKAVIDGATVTGAGSANLADQSLNMRMVATLSKERSQEVGGTGIGGFMRTALANQNGELVIPVQVTGTFAKPKFAPDMQRIAQMKMEGLSTNPVGTVQDILGTFGGKKKQQQPPPDGQPQSQQQPPDGQQPAQTGTQPQPKQPDLLQQILDATKKRQQKNQPPPAQPSPSPTPNQQPKDYSEEPPPDQPK